VTRPRAADDFPMIRARMEELRRERVRPRAADDFATIRARMELEKLMGLVRADPRSMFDENNAVLPPELSPVTGHEWSRGRASREILGV
jgi:hypothetical protein